MTNNIELTNGYHIRIENYDYILCKRKVIEKGNHAGEIVDVFVGYYGKLNQTVRKYLERVAIEEGDETLQLNEFAAMVELVLDRKTKQIVSAIRETIDD